MKWLANLLRSRERHQETKETPRGQRRGRLPTIIEALWSRSQNSAIPATIRDLGLTGVRIEAAKGATIGSTSTLRIAVSKNFEARDTQTFLTLQVVAVRCNRSRDGRHYEIGMRFAEANHPARDRWVELVLQQCGFEIRPEQERASQRLRPLSTVPVVVETRAGQARGRVIDISTSGALLHLEGIEFSSGAEVRLHVGPWSDGSTLHVGAQVVRSRGEAQDASHLLAVRFEGLEDAVLKALEKQMERAQSEN